MSPDDLADPPRRLHVKLGRAAPVIVLGLALSVCLPAQRARADFDFWRDVVAPVAAGLVCGPPCAIAVRVPLNPPQRPEDIIVDLIPFAVPGGGALSVVVPEVIVACEDGYIRVDEVCRPVRELAARGVPMDLGSPDENPVEAPPDPDAETLDGPAPVLDLEPVLEPEEHEAEASLEAEDFHSLRDPVFGTPVPADAILSPLDARVQARVWVAPVAEPLATGVYGEPRGGGPHEGEDFRALEPVPVFAIGAGTVAATSCPSPRAGNCVIIDHGDGLSSRTLHLSQVLVQPDQIVEPGQLIGLSGATGVTSRGGPVPPHVHVEVHDGTGATLDPELLYGQQPRRLP